MRFPLPRRNSHIITAYHCICHFQDFLDLLIHILSSPTTTHVDKIEKNSRTGAILVETLHTDQYRSWHATYLHRDTQSRSNDEKIPLQMPQDTAFHWQFKNVKLSAVLLCFSRLSWALRAQKNKKIGIGSTTNTPWRVAIVFNNIMIQPHWVKNMKQCQAPNRFCYLFETNKT